MTDEAAATQYAKLQERIEQSLPKMDDGFHGRQPSWAAGYQPNVDQAHRALLDSERKAWVNAYGSPYLKLRWAGRTSGRCTEEDARMFTREWCRATAAAAVTPRQGWFFERRLPGDVRGSKFFVTPQGVELLGAVRFAPTVDDPSVHSRQKREQEMLAWCRKRAWTDAGVAGQSLSVLAGRAEDAITHRDWLEQQKTRPDPLARAERVREFFGYGHRCSSLDARARAFLGIAADGTAEFLVSVAGRGYQVESARMKSSLSAGEIAKLKTLVVPPEQARALRVQCELTKRLEIRYERRVARVSERTARGRFDRLITTTDGRKCAVIITDKALYLVQQGKEDWRRLIGRDVAVQKRPNGVSIQPVERSRLQVFGLGR